MVPPHRKTCCHRASSSTWTVTRSIPVVTVSSWTTPLLLQRRTPYGLGQVTVTSQQKALAWPRVAPLRSLREVSRNTKSCSPTARMFLMSTVAQQSVPIAVATDQRSFQSYSSGVLTASRDMLYQLFGVGALAHRGLLPCSGVCAGCATGFPRTAPSAREGCPGHCDTLAPTAILD